MYELRTLSANQVQRVGRKIKVVEDIPEFRMYFIVEQDCEEEDVSR